MVDTRKRRLILVGALLIAAVAAVLSHFAREARYDRLVANIIHAPQRYDGSHLDDLVELGPAAVGAIGRALSKGVKFPSELVLALERIGSERGIEPLLGLLEKHGRYSEPDALTQTTILALRGVGNRKACEPLSAILHDESAVARTRLYVAQAIANLCKTEEARRFILDEYARHDGVNSVGSAQGYPYSAVVLALIDVDTDESETLLLELLRGNFFSPVLPAPIIDHLASRGGQPVVDALLSVATDKRKFEFPGRLAAVRGLVDLDALPQSVLLPIVMDLAAEVETDFASRSPEFVSRIVLRYLEEARRLKAEMESR